MGWRPPYLLGLFGITAICGLIDAACFLALGGVFAEIMTGNLVLLAFNIGFGEQVSETISGISPVHYISALVCFAVGAVLGGLIVRKGSIRFDRHVGFSLELVLLLLATTIAVITNPGHTGPARDVVVALLAVAMGLQNALLRARGAPDLATNVMTLTFTALIADSTLAGGENPRWARRGGSILTFVVAAAIGAWLARYGGRWPLVVATGVFAASLWPLLASEPPGSSASPPPPAQRYSQR